MPLLYRIKDKDGHYRMVEQFTDAVQPVALTLPGSTSTPGVVVKRYFCTACKPKKGFKGTGVLAMHFKRAHPDLFKDKDTWRQHFEEFGGLLNGTNAPEPDSGR